MTEVDQLARFAKAANYEDLSPREVEALKIRLVDSIAVAIAALDCPVPRAMRRFAEVTGPKKGSHFIGSGISSPPLASLYNSTLIRYLDFNDSILTRGETFHPSDVVGGLLTFGDCGNASGRELLTAMALSYQIQRSLSEVAPVRAKGFDHTVQLGYAAAASLSKLMALSEDQMANAIAITGTVNNPLRVSRTGRLSHWKGLAAPFTVFNAANASLLAREGITGPREVFEGNKGFKEAIAGPFTIDWTTVELSAAQQSILKKFNAEIHSQSALELTLRLQHEYEFRADDIEAVFVEIFDVAYHIIGGGEEGQKQEARTKEEADHSLPYLIAVATLDGDVTPKQFEPSRIMASDVQTLMRRIQISPSIEMSRRFPDEMPVQINITLKDGRKLEGRGRDYEGFTSQPMTIEGISHKFEKLTAPVLSSEKRRAILDCINHIEEVSVRDLMRELTF